MTLINLSLFNSNNKISNSEWTNTLKKPLNITKNSIITLKQAYIDINTAGQYQVISINNDIQILLEFGFCVLYTPDIIDPLLDSTKPTPQQPNAIYIARDSTPGGSLSPIMSVKQFTLPAGEYGPSDLAVYMTSRMSEFIYQDITDFLQNSNNSFMRPITYIPRITAPDININDDYIISEFVSVFFNSANPILDKYAVGDAVQFSCYDTLNKQTIKINGGTISSITRNTNSAGQVQLTILTTVFNPNNKNPEILPGPNIYSDVYLEDPSKTQQLVFYNQNDIYDELHFAISPTAAPNGVLVGSSQVGVLFNNNNSNRFELLAHSPLYEKTADTNPSIYAYKESGSSNIIFADKFASTPFFTLAPSNFWQDLGFDLTKCIISNGPNIIVPPITTGVNTTGGFVSYDTIIASTRVNYAIPSNTYWYGTNLFKNIIASSNFISSGSGYYLLELSGMCLSEYIDDNQAKNTIFCVISRNYDTSGYVTVYGGSEARNIYNGEPYQISSISVRILDPISMTPLSNSILGKNNSIYIEIITPEDD